MATKLGPCGIRFCSKLRGRTSRDLHATRRSIRLFLATLSGAFNSHRAYKCLLIHRYCASLLLRTTRNTQQVHTASIKWSTVRKLRYIAVVAAHSKYNARDIKYASKIMQEPNGITLRNTIKYASKVK